MLVKASDSAYTHLVLIISGQRNKDTFGTANRNFPACFKGNAGFPVDTLQHAYDSHHAAKSPACHPFQWQQGKCGSAVCEA